MEGSLFIKQSAILEVIKEYRLISSNNLRKQFMGIKDRTFRYHLKKLADLGLIRKRGTTKGAYYELASN